MMRVLSLIVFGFSEGYLNFSCFTFTYWHVYLEIYECIYTYMFIATFLCVRVKTIWNYLSGWVFIYRCVSVNMHMCVSVLSYVCDFICVYTCVGSSHWHRNWNQWSYFQILAESVAFTFTQTSSGKAWINFLFLHLLLK